MQYIYIYTDSHMWHIRLMPTSKPKIGNKYRFFFSRLVAIVMCSMCTRKEKEAKKKRGKEQNYVYQSNFLFFLILHAHHVDMKRLVFLFFLASHSTHLSIIQQISKYSKISHRCVIQRDSNFDFLERITCFVSFEIAQYALRSNDRS